MNAANGCRARAIATGPSSPELVTSATLDRDARLYRESFSRCRRDVSSPQRDEHVRNLIKRVENGRIHLAEHQLLLAWDAFMRGAPQADVEAPGHTYVTIVRAWYAARRRGESLDLASLVRIAFEAQGAAAAAEVTAIAIRTPKAIADAEDAVARELLADVEVLEAFREMNYHARAAA